MFDVQNNLLGDVGVSSIAGGFTSELHDMKLRVPSSLSSSSLSSLSSPSLSPPLTLSKLTLFELDLSSNDIGDIGVQALCSGLSTLVRNAHRVSQQLCLRVLRLNRNRITDKGARALAQLVDMGGLAAHDSERSSERSDDRNSYGLSSSERSHIGLEESFLPLLLEELALGDNSIGGAGVGDILRAASLPPGSSVPGSGTAEGGSKGDSVRSPYLPSDNGSDADATNGTNGMRGMVGMEGTDGSRRVAAARGVGLRRLDFSRAALTVESVRALTAYLTADKLTTDKLTTDKLAAGKGSDRTSFASGSASSSSGATFSSGQNISPAPPLPPSESNGNHVLDGEVEGEGQNEGEGESEGGYIQVGFMFSEKQAENMLDALYKAVASAAVAATRKDKLTAISSSYPSSSSFLPPSVHSSSSSFLPSTFSSSSASSSAPVSVLTDLFCDLSAAAGHKRVKVALGFLPEAMRRRREGIRCALGGPLKEVARGMGVTKDMMEMIEVREMRDIEGALEAMEGMRAVLDLPAELGDWVLRVIVKPKSDAAAAAVSAKSLAGAPSEAHPAVSGAGSNEGTNVGVKDSTRDGMRDSIKDSKDGVGVSADHSADYSPSDPRRDEDWDTTWDSSFDYLSPMKMVSSLEAFRARADMVLAQPHLSLRNGDSNSNNSNISRNIDGHDITDDTTHTNNHKPAHALTPAHAADNGNSDAFDDFSRLTSPLTPPVHRAPRGDLFDPSPRHTPLTDTEPGPEDAPFSPGNSSVFMTEIPDEMTVSVTEPPSGYNPPGGDIMRGGAPRGDVTRGEIEDRVTVESRRWAHRREDMREGGSGNRAAVADVAEDERDRRDRDRRDGDRDRRDGERGEQEVRGRAVVFDRGSDTRDRGRSLSQASFRRERSRERVAQQLLAVGTPLSPLSAILSVRGDKAESGGGGEGGESLSVVTERARTMERSRLIAGRNGLDEKRVLDQLSLDQSVSFIL